LRKFRANNIAIFLKPAAAKNAADFFGLIKKLTMEISQYRFQTMKAHKIIYFLAAFLISASAFADVLVLSAPKVSAAKTRAAAVQASPLEAPYELRAQNIEVFKDAVLALKNFENEKDLPTIRLSLFDDASFDIKITKLKTNSFGVFSASGKIDGSPNSYAIITVLKNGLLTANIYDAEKNYNYKIVCDSANSAQTAIESDVAKMPNLPCKVAIPKQGGAK